MSSIDLDKLSAVEQAGSPAPWAYSTGCGAQVCIGIVHLDEPGTVMLEKRGVFLFEIEPFVYDDLDDELGDDERDDRAQADARLIALARNYLPLLIAELKAERAGNERLEQENVALRQELKSLIRRGP